MADYTNAGRVFLYASDDAKLDGTAVAAPCKRSVSQGIAAGFYRTCRTFYVRHGIQSRIAQDSCYVVCFI